MAPRGNTNTAADNDTPESKSPSKSTEKAANQSGPSNLEYSNGAVHSSPQQTIQKFENCTALNRVYLHGVGLSGGVDSSVAAVLIEKAIGKQLKCIFVNTGLLRKNEEKNYWLINWSSWRYLGGKSTKANCSSI